MRTLALALMACMTACASSEERPADLLPRDKFTQVLLEAQLIEARVNHEAVIDKRTEIPSKEYYAEMFKAQGVTEDAFRSTFNWYVHHPADLKVVYNDVLTGLQKRVDVADSTETAH
jgi:hypothetical protein